MLQSTTKSRSPRHDEPSNNNPGGKYTPGGKSTKRSTKRQSSKGKKALRQQQRAERPAMTADDARKFDVRSETNAAILEAVSMLKDTPCSCDAYADWFTYNRWQAQGMQVQKGEHGTEITCYRVVPVQRTEPVQGSEAEQYDTPPAVIRIPYTTKVFCRCQVKPITDSRAITIVTPAPVAQPVAKPIANPVAKVEEAAIALVEHAKQVFVEPVAQEPVAPVVIAPIATQAVTVMAQPVAAPTVPSPVKIAPVARVAPVATTSDAFGLLRDALGDVDEDTVMLKLSKPLAEITQRGYKAGTIEVIMLNAAETDDKACDTVRYCHRLLTNTGKWAAIIPGVAYKGSSSKAEMFREWLNDLGIIPTQAGNGRLLITLVR